MTMTDAEKNAAMESALATLNRGAGAVEVPANPDTYFGPDIQQWPASIPTEYNQGIAPLGNMTVGDVMRLGGITSLGAGQELNTQQIIEKAGIVRNVQGGMPSGGEAGMEVGVGIGAGAGLIGFAAGEQLPIVDLWQTGAGDVTSAGLFDIPSSPSEWLDRLSGKDFASLVESQGKELVTGEVGGLVAAVGGGGAASIISKLLGATSLPKWLIPLLAAGGGFLASKLLGGADLSALGITGDDSQIGGTDMTMTTAGTQVGTAGIPVGGIGVAEPPAGMVAKQWKILTHSNTTGNYYIYFFKLLDGRIMCYNPPKGWKIWRPKKNMVISSNPRISMIKKLDRVYWKTMRTVAKKTKMLKLAKA